MGSYQRSLLMILVMCGLAARGGSSGGGGNAQPPPPPPPPPPPSGNVNIDNPTLVTADNNAVAPGDTLTLVWSDEFDGDIDDVEMPP